VELLLINSMFLYYFPKHGSFTVQKPCIAGTCPSYKRLPCKVILFNVQSDTQKNVAFCKGSPALPTCPMLPVPQNAQSFQLLQSHFAFQSHICSRQPLQGVL